MLTWFSGYSTVKKKVADFKRSRKSTADDARIGIPKSTITDAHVEGINRMLMNGDAIERVTV